VIAGAARGRRLHLDGAGGRAVSGTGPAAEELRRGLDRIFEGLGALARPGNAFRAYLDGVSQAKG